MKNKTIFGLAAAVSLLAGAQQGTAATYSDNDVLGTTIASGGTLSGTFAIGSVNDGSGTFAYDPSSELLSSAIASFSFSRANALLGNVEILLGGTTFSTTLTVINSLVGTLSGSVLGVNLADLAADGILSYTIKNNSTTSVKVTSAVVAAQASARPVPDVGSTACLIGMGLIALGCIGFRPKMVSK